MTDFKLGLPNRLLCILATAGALALGGCATPDRQFYANDPLVRGFVRLAEDGFLEMIPNRALAPTAMIERYPPGSRNYQIFTNGLGGVRPGEIKVVRAYSAIAYMDASGTISVQQVVYGGDAITSPSPGSRTSRPSDLSYCTDMQMFRLRKPGDAYLILIPRPGETVVPPDPGPLPEYCSKWPYRPGQ